LSKISPRSHEGFRASPEAEADVWNIWVYLTQEAGPAVADRIETTLFGEMDAIAGEPGIGHWPRDLTDAPVRFFSVYSYLIVYCPQTQPLQVVAVLHGRRDIEELLKDRL